MSKIQNGTIHVQRQSDAYWRVIFDIPPLNIFGPANIPQFEQVVSSIEADDRVKVVVFASAVEGFFLTHYDFLAKLAPLDQSSAAADVSSVMLTGCLGRSSTCN